MRLGIPGLGSPEIVAESLTFVFSEATWGGDGVDDSRFAVVAVRIIAVCGTRKKGGKGGREGGGSGGSVGVVFVASFRVVCSWL